MVENILNLNLKIESKKVRYFIETSYGDELFTKFTSKNIRVIANGSNARESLLTALLTG